MSESTARGAALLGLLGLVVTALAVPLGVASATGATARESGEPKPTIVLVHGGWADASSWDAVAQRLQDDGYTVIAPANPLRGVQTDAEYLSSVLATISGPIVLVGTPTGAF